MTKSAADGVKAHVVGAIAAATVGGVLAWLTPFWSWLLSQSIALSAHLHATTVLPNWILYLLILISAQSVLYWLLRAVTGNKDADHTQFVELPFLGSLWRWGYLGGTPTNPWAFCPQCDTQLVYEDVGGAYSTEPRRTLLHCERCSVVRTTHEGNVDYLKGRVLREVERVIRTGEWREHASKPQK